MNTITAVDNALAEYEARCIEYASLRAEESRLEDERHGVKQQALLRIMATENSLTGKPHSASSAESVVQLDPTYAAYLARQREVVLQKNIEHGKTESARIRALALANMSAQLLEAA